MDDRSIISSDVQGAMQMQRRDFLTATGYHHCMAARCVWLTRTEGCRQVVEVRDAQERNAGTRIVSTYIDGFAIFSLAECGNRVTQILHFGYSSSVGSRGTRYLDTRGFWPGEESADSHYGHAAKAATHHATREPLLCGGMDGG